MNSTLFTQTFLDGVRDFVLINWDGLISESSPDTVVVVVYNEHGLGAEMAVRTRDQVRESLLKHFGESPAIAALNEPSPMGALLVTVVAPHAEGSKFGFLFAHKEQQPTAEA